MTVRLPTCLEISTPVRNRHGLHLQQAADWIQVLSTAGIRVLFQTHYSSAHLSTCDSCAWGGHMDNAARHNVVCADFGYSILSS